MMLYLHADEDDDDEKEGICWLAVLYTCALHVHQRMELINH